MRRMRFACWLTKATDIYSDYIIFLAVRRQMWISERASVLRYTYISCLVSLNNVKQLAFLRETSDLLARCAQLRTIQINVSLERVTGKYVLQNLILNPYRTNVENRVSS